MVPPDTDAKSRFHTAAQQRARARWVLAAVLAVVLAAAGVLWRFTPLSQWADAERMAEWMDSLHAAWWAPLAVLGLYVLGGLIMLPITLLITATAVVFQPLQAAALSFIGVLANAAVTYAVGAHLVRDTLHAAFGHKVRRVSAAFADRGVIAVAAIRMVPIAPFSVVNIAAGSVALRQRDYLLGTALGIVPGILVLTLFGHQLRAILEHPSPSNLAMPAAVILGWIGLSLLLQRFVSRRNARRAPQ